MTPDRPTPVPYDGIDFPRIQGIGHAHEQIGYYGDVASNHTRYRFNALGYRGDDFVPTASPMVFAFGDSHTFGLGLDHEACWAKRFVHHWSVARGLDPTAACLQNFADPGASNASIARAVLTQCHAVRPDLVIVMFAPIQRTEGVAQGKAFPIGWWTIARPKSGGGAVGGVEDEWRTRARAYFDFANDEACILETLRSILLVQYYCRAMQIRFVAACDGIGNVLRTIAATPVLAALGAQVDRTVICDFDVWSPPGLRSANAVERSRDGAHAGAGQHDAFAQDLVRFAMVNET
jgi:hypothetical protein